MKKEKYIKPNLMDKARAAVCFCDSQNSEETNLEAFMGIFHPEKQKDRVYMNKLKRGMKGN